MSVVAPVPTCERCGARAKAPGPIIEMEPAPTPRDFGDLFPRNVSFEEQNARFVGFAISRGGVRLR